MLREQNQVNLMLLNSHKNHIIWFFFLPVFGKAHPGPPENLVCNSKKKVKVLIKNKNYQKKVAETVRNVFAILKKIS